ncbi:hypothetical protein [Rhodococcus sp. OK302]|nr:hypothetical protein [Rhodococcus sp. OK302]
MSALSATPWGKRTLVVAFHHGRTYEHCDLAQVLFDELTHV